MSRFTRSWRLWVAVLLVAPVVLAQEAPKPGPEHARLRHLEGVWDAALKFGEEGSKGTMTYKMDIGGLWLIGDYQGEFMGEKFTGKSLDSYDLNKKKYVSVWIDSISTSPMLTEGDFDAAGKIQTMIGKGPGLDGTPMRFRMTIEHVGPDKLHQTMYGGEEGQEFEMMTIDYTRRK